jgi:tRNA pseudouridine38-40 synthase
LKTRYFTFLSFDGSSYHGWQDQPNSNTVQKTLERALSLVLGEEIKITGAGRTDSGVHAEYFCAHFDSVAHDLDTRKNFIFRINKILPKDISVSSLIKVRPDAHARFSAMSRTYRYDITRFKDPFSSDMAWHIYGPLDVEKMNEACSVLYMYSDFTSFSRLHTDVKTNNCRIYRAQWEQDGDRISFTIKADRFLRNMVRAIVGTMIQLGQGKKSVSDFESVILARDRCKAGQSAPAKGLFLIDVEYPPEIFILPSSDKK